MAKQFITIREPDDLHVHVREGIAAKRLINFTADEFARATIMPNLSKPITTVAMAESYCSLLKEATYWPSMSHFHRPFQPLMTLYLTDQTTVEEIELAASKKSEEFYIIGAKLYPSGATTNSAAGVTQISQEAPIWKVFAAMERFGLPLLIHGETAEGDVFDREQQFVIKYLSMIVDAFPNLKIVLEHITTKFAAVWLMEKFDKGKIVGATITPHHLLADRNDMLANGLRPHHYCKPILKRDSDRQFLLEAATSDYPCFFGGTDSAPHALHKKESACCAAGCFVAPHAVELYAEAFESVGKINKLEQFLSVNGANFFGLPLNEIRRTLIRGQHTVQQEPYRVEDENGGYSLQHFWSGRKLNWILQ